MICATICNAMAPRRDGRQWLAADFLRGEERQKPTAEQVEDKARAFASRGARHADSR